MWMKEEEEEEVDREEHATEKYWAISLSIDLDNL